MPEDDLDINMADALSEMSTDFGGGGSAPSSADADPSQVRAPSTAPAAAAAPATNPAAPAVPAAPDPWKALPKSWKRDYEQKYAALDPEVQQYIHQREKEALEGLMHYKGQFDPFDSVLKKYEAAFKQIGVAPHEAFDHLINAHLVLSNAPADVKAQYARALLKDYGLEGMLQGGAGAPAAPVQDPRIDQLFGRVGQFEKFINDSNLRETTQAVNAFLNDPKNEFASEVLSDMTELLERGAATTLQEAYDIAMHKNPVVRGKILQREIEKAAKPQKAPPTRLESSAVPPNPTGGKKATLEETLADVYDNLTK